MEARAVAEGLGEPGALSIGNHGRSAQPCAAVGLPWTLRALAPYPIGEGKHRSRSGESGTDEGRGRRSAGENQKDFFFTPFR